MNNLTQSRVDAEIALLKKQILNKIGNRSIAIAVMSDKSIMDGLSVYELEFLPAILELGFNAPTVSELFGVNLSIKDCSNSK